MDTITMKLPPPPAGAGGGIFIYKQKMSLGPSGCRYISRLLSGDVAAQ